MRPQSPGPGDSSLRVSYRIERSRSSPGNGLGLSLVAVVARVHRADVELEDNSPRLKVRLRFPRADITSS